MSSFLTIDLGTTTVKTSVIDLEKGLRARHRIKYESIKPSKGYHEQDPNVWWTKIKESVNAVMSKSDIDKGEIVAVTIVSQRGTILPIDSNNKPLHNALTWMDARKPEIKDDQKQLTSGRISLEKILWFKQFKPKIYEETQKFLLSDSYLTLILTGKAVTSPSQAVYLHYDEVKGDYDFDILEDLGIDPSKLPSVKSSTTVVGELNAEVANELGLKTGTPVVLGAGDQQAAALGLGVINKGQAKITLGTGLFIDAPVENRLIDFYDDNLKIFCLPHAIENRWLVEATVPAIGQTLEWFSQNFAGDLKEKALSLKIEPLSLLDEEASEVQASKDNPIFVPLISFGLGSWRNISMHHDRATLYRSILESAGFSSRFFLELITGLGLEIEDIYVEGGGAASKVWLQILSDIVQRTLKIPKAKEYASGLGGAVLAALALREVSDPLSFTSELREITEEVKPSEKDLEVYEHLFEIFTNNLLEEASKI